MIGSADVWYHNCDTNQSRTCNHKIRGRLKAIFTYYLILPAISNVLHTQKISRRGLCLLFRTLYLQNISVFVHNKATPCFGCKYITVVSLQNYVISEWSQSPRLIAPSRRAHIGMKSDIHGQGLYISIAHIMIENNCTWCKHLIFYLVEYPCWVINLHKNVLLLINSIS